ncbi:DNA mismatch repair protein C-terminal [Penicillium maclennaniae]|uniref:DNA mismatch repair protein C-terminal n=1 Tax=Penicillium maclennaniae TaxID=1343394 RepID=UPI002541B882|nr:DNA mismatch repair protein C-terminal [Penicillium maclennaniae]KAJ5675176.1 DNA mismatch repair protein C-terminal [Penicillium maclennaniae]
MPIVALPQTTVRAIGSTSVISDPCSVVKELIDNALDASATSLQVELTQNTLDVIQVKDNGHGIPTEDHSSVCKHTFTSKIQTVDDLKNVGGSSFGFRGEALASVAEMSGGITISTRSASEVTGTCLKYARDGSLSSYTRTSHPAGTTLRVTDFLKYIPVRRQTALKDATKTLTKIKKLLQAYAFARPAVRFSMKVLKAKNENNSWMYAPSADAGIADAAIKVVGRDVSSCCVVKNIASESLNPSGHELLAFLPKADELVKANNQGQFISVDGRPLSISRGFGLNVAKLFKSYARAAASRNEAAKSIADPFLCLQLKCPQGTYDINIEPGKDDVLFEDRELIFGILESFFRETYGPLPDAQKASPKKAQKASVAAQRNTGFEILMSRTRPEIPSNQSQSPEIPASVAPGSSLSQQSGHQSSGPLSPDSYHDGAFGNATGGHTATAECRGSRFINPWSISRINASFQTPQRQRAPQSSGPPTVFETAQHSDLQQDAAMRPDYQSPPQSSDMSSSTPGPASISLLAHQRRSQPSMGSLPGTASTATSGRKAARQRDKERYGNGALDTLFQRTTGASLTQQVPEPTAELDFQVPTLSQLAQERFQSPPQPPQPSIGEVVPALEDRGVGDEYSEAPESQPSPQEAGALPTDQNQEPEGSMDSGRGFPVLEKWAASLHEGFNPNASLDLEWALDFEKRKKEANQRNRARPAGRDFQESSQITTCTGLSPHKNRYVAAKAALSADQSAAAETTSVSSLPQHDPRAYLMRYGDKPDAGGSAKNSAAARRLHASRLPLERTPEEYNIHNVCLPMTSDLSLTSQLLNLTCPIDTYTHFGKEAGAFSGSNTESILSFWNQRLITLVNEKYTAGDKLPSSEWPIDLASIIEQHLKQFPTH